ncbi:MAG: D-alanyl-D-alanine carboxypeptidase DacC [Alphaproteobacteria bacterium MarineAlpha9_Bin2]|nr:MAG: D-alanyl-D-alanine carboxypeptidase DacC [Alphaproteobacteria bacterium MarineAlpha9_Bin2]
MKKKTYKIKLINMLINFLFLIVITEEIKAERIINTSAKQALLIDFNTDRILLNNNADVSMAPASMSKLMTVYLAFEALAQRRVKLNTNFVVSEKAWRRKDKNGNSLPPSGSSMFLEPNTRVEFEDLLRGIIVQSGNDACIVIAEGLSGSESSFVKEMNKKSEALGLTNSKFMNSTGWPVNNHYMSSLDLATLTKRLYIDFPQYMYYFSEKKFEYNGISQPNRNSLLFAGIGADGLKTGYTKKSGYGVVASAFQDGRRLILVLNGLKSKNNRAVESENIMNWGFREFENIELFSQHDVVERAPVWLGDIPYVDLIVREKVLLTIAKGLKGKDLKAVIKYSSPIIAPIDIDEIVGKLIIRNSRGKKIKEYNLYPLEEVKKAGPIGRLFSSLSYLIWGESILNDK